MDSHQQIIQKSHQRSRSLGVNPDRIIPGKILTGHDLEKCLAHRKELINTVTPFINELYNFLKGSGFFVILSDEKGCILTLTGDEDIIKEARKYKMVPGAIMTEESVGTNAIGTVLIENKPLQLTKTDHYVKAYQRWTCSAAPIHDPENRMIGTINLTGNSEKAHPHTLGIVVETVRTIENHLENVEIQKQLYDSNMYAFAMMNNLSYGIFAIDLNDNIHWVNNTACDTLNIRRLNLLNQPIIRYVRDWSKLKRTTLVNGNIQDEEAILTYNNESVTYLINLFPIETPEKEILGYLLSFRPLSRMLRLLNKYTGQQARFTFGDIIGISKKIKDTLSYAKTVANSPTTLLITGESGTGKEVFAQAIHNASDRRDEPFIALNCGAISPGLIESELFGYADGAFTGAKKGGNPGKFELANKGTLFLDEIGEMPVDMQVRLLRALQENAVNRIGSSKTIPVNVRIIAATNKNLEVEIKKGKFRLDLFYRLNVVPLHIPPLRERKEDIMPLLKYFLKHKASKLKKTVPRIDDDLADRIMIYNWPGNIREIENFAEKLVILGGNLSPDMMDDEFRAIHANKEENLSGKPDNFHEQLKPRLQTLQDTEKEMIIQTFEILGNNISQVAKSLGISRNALYQKMKRYEIRHPG
ncbi:MAG: sigma 54-interacting transcriptional regulator [Bacteroidota bacterium]|nr:sigma 54-interacting transcriptional regulator [Bacteroidota bacterium]